jgi:four helix bundle protein
VQDFRKLAVWHNACDVAVIVYRLTASYPSAERYGPVAQLRSSAISVSSNIAEGCGRRGAGELSRFLEIAIGSCSELESQLSQRLGYLLDEPGALEAVTRLKKQVIKLQQRVDQRR